MKILSICMPSYNMENYLDRSLKSILIPEILDELEIIIVNDGSKDCTLEIANKYKKKYPNSIVVIDKTNGHYGSCVNAALRVATAKYFRILDADDWFDSKALVSVVMKLKTIDVDAIYTPYSIYYEKRDKYESQSTPNNIVWEKTYLLNDFQLSYPFLHMHSLTYKTELFHKISYYQTEGICYTDTEYVYKLLGAARSLYCVNECLYQYYVGRNDQSTSTKVLSRNYDHFYKVFQGLISYQWPHPNNNIEYLKYEYIRILCEYLISIHLEYYYDDELQGNNLRDTLLHLNSIGVELTMLDCMKIGPYKFAKRWYEKRRNILDRFFWEVKYVKDCIVG